MSTNFYQDLLDPGNENNSDVSEVGPDDLANIVKGVDDIDDALFGFKPKPQDTQKTIASKTEPKPSERPKSSFMKQPNVLDLPDGDLLADISLSDDDFYDVGKKTSVITRDQDKASSTTKMPTQDKLTKSKKIANLFGLDEEDVMIESKKKQESAADWLGIKDSPVKAMPKSIVEDNLETQARTVLTDPLSIHIQDKPKSNPPDIKVTPSKSTIAPGTETASVSVQGSIDEVKTFTHPITKPLKTGDNIFDLLSDKNEQSKSTENPKDKKSAIFDELFGERSVGQKKTSRSNSLVKTLEVSNTEHTGPTMGDDSSVSLGQYVPSAGSVRRPGLGRRRETTPVLLTTPSTPSLFQEDWLTSSDQQESKKENTKVRKHDTKSSGVEVHESLPSWLGGSGVLADKKTVSKTPTQAAQEKPVEKSEPINQTSSTTKLEEAANNVAKEPEAQATDAAREVLVTSSEQSQQTVLALQRTEAQLLTALELQSTQSNLSAVCARQRTLLDAQEKQLAQLVARQTDRQVQVEKQLTIQQQRIQQLLEVLTVNILSPQVEIVQKNEVPVAEYSVAEKVQEKVEIVQDLEREIHKATLENEELRMRMELMGKHYKMEYESLQIQHKREIESWEDKLAMQKELSDKVREDFKERIARLKENEAELIVQHNARVQRLREEKAEDIRQLMDLHRMTLEQMMVLNNFVSPAPREEQKMSSQTWKYSDTNQMSEKEEELYKKENMLTALQAKIEAQKLNFDKKVEEMEDKVEQEKLKNEEVARKLKQEKNQLKYQQQQLNQEKKHMEEQYYEQRKQLEDMQEKIVSEQTQLATEKLKLAEERAKLDALAKLQGVGRSATFDVLKSKAEVHGALEAARSAELQAVEERKKLREKERILDTERWKIKEMEEDLIARVQHMDRLMQVSEANQQTGQKALEEAKQLEKRAEEKLQEVERRNIELKEKEKNLIKIKLDIAQEEIRLNRKREQLEHILPPLSSNEIMSLQPLKDVIDPKKLIMKLRAEREFEAISRPHQPGNEHPHP